MGELIIFQDGWLGTMARVVCLTVCLIVSVLIIREIGLSCASSERERLSLIETRSYEVVERHMTTTRSYSVFGFIERYSKWEALWSCEYRR
jgi:hypothetical protein